MLSANRKRIAEGWHRLLKETGYASVPSEEMIASNMEAIQDESLESFMEWISLHSAEQHHLTHFEKVSFEELTRQGLLNESLLQEAAESEIFAQDDALSVHRFKSGEAAYLQYGTVRILFHYLRENIQALEQELSSLKKRHHLFQSQYQHLAETAQSLERQVESLAPFAEESDEAKEALHGATFLSHSLDECTRTMQQFRLLRDNNDSYLYQCDTQELDNERHLHYQALQSYFERQFHQQTLVKALSLDETWQNNQKRDQRYAALDKEWQRLKTLAPLTEKQCLDAELALQREQAKLASLTRDLSLLDHHSDPALSQIEKEVESSLSMQRTASLMDRFFQADFESALKGNHALQVKRQDYLMSRLNQMVQFMSNYWHGLLLHGALLQAEKSHLLQHQKEMFSFIQYWQQQMNKALERLKSLEDDEALDRRQRLTVDSRDSLIMDLIKILDLKENKNGDPLLLQQILDQIVPMTTTEKIEKVPSLVTESFLSLVALDKVLCKDSDNARLIHFTHRDISTIQQKLCQQLQQLQPSMLEVAQRLPMSRLLQEQAQLFSWFHAAPDRLLAAMKQA